MVASVPNITVKNIPRELHRKLKNRARAHHRSLNREVIATLQAAASQTHPIHAPALVREARAVRKKVKRPTTPAQIEAWIQSGRR